MELKTKIGIENIIFGLLRPKIEELLGAPDKKTKDIDDPNISIWQYNEQRIRLSFYKNEGGRLGYIRCSNPNLTFDNQLLINQKIKEVKLDILKMPNKEWEVEEYDFYTTHFYEDSWILLTTEYGFVTGVEIGVTFKSDEEYNWPK